MVSLELGLDVLRSYKRLPYTEWHALAEFVDNSTQSYFNNQSTLDAALAEAGEPFKVSIVYDRNAPGLFRITDNAMGMSLTELQRALLVGIPPEDTSGRSKYGLGMKMAACWYGNLWTIRTKRLDETTEHEVTVDVERVASGDAELPYRAFSDKDPRDHYTIIEITRLNRRPQGRTLGKIKDFLRSMYRVDIRNGVMELEWQHELLQWELNEAFVQARDGSYFKRDFQFSVDGKHVWGWVGVLDRGSRAKAGFSILHSGRVVKGWPDSWRPEAIYGQVQGSNDLVNQRLTGEINLDVFEVTHTKDNIQWMGSEEDDVQEALRKECSEYREIARSRRREPRPITDLEVQTAVQELEAELNSNEFIDLLATEPVPPPEVVAADAQALVSGLDLTDPQFSSSVSLLPDRTLQIAGYLAFETSVNDPYVISEATSPSRVIVVINMNHPHVQQVSGSDGLLNYFRHCTYDAIAEWQARNRASTTDPDTIKLIKDRLLRLPMSIQMHEARA
jgi:hypothetical protein